MTIPFWGAFLCGFLSFGVMLVVIGIAVIEFKLGGGRVYPPRFPPPPKMQAFDEWQKIEKKRSAIQQLRDSVNG